MVQVIRRRKRTPISSPRIGDPVQWGGLKGAIVKRDQAGKNVWAEFEDTEETVMFSIRADAMWRAFPYRADGPPLLERIPEKA